MMSIVTRIRRLLRHPPREILRRLAAFAQRHWRQWQLRLRDRVVSTFPSTPDMPREPLRQLIAPVPAEQLLPWAAALIAEAGKIVQHRFSLLGAQDVEVRHGMEAIGLEGHRYPAAASASGDDVNHANRSRSHAIKRLIRGNYVPIDWHIDLRSGYRWPVTTPYSRTAYGALPGVDVKLPWELARMHHAPILALAATVQQHAGEHEAARQLHLEFQNQILDFIAANPPRFGVNWACTMDVAIRIANMLIARDLFIGAGMPLPAEFEHEFLRSVVAHGRHIISNLEWYEHLRSNHYLSNIAGLLFVAAYLPPSSETDGWLALAANELGKELFSQFQPDGSNFEASTSYHRLSSEMVTWAVALAQRVAPRLATLDLQALAGGLNADGPGLLPAQRTVPAPHALTSAEALRQLERMAEFSLAITRPDGCTVQIGDNDSGHFVNLTPSGVDEHQWNAHAMLISSIRAVCGASAAIPASPDAIVIGRLNGLPARAASGIAAVPAMSPGMMPFPDFGIYVYRQDPLWLTVRCGSVGQNGNGGHAHNDQLSLEICFAGVAFVADPGTYVYTPLPTMRNALRSTAAHATLVADPGEQNDWLPGREGLFSLSRVAATRVIETSDRRFVGEHDGFRCAHRRSVEIVADGIAVVDACEGDGRRLVLPLAPGVEVVGIDAGTGSCLLSKQGVQVRLVCAGAALSVENAIFSPGYGKRVPTQVLHLREIAALCQWSMTMEANTHG